MRNPQATGAWLVLGVAGLAGFLQGALAYPTWHHAMETAQVHSGLVEYPPGNPFYLYHIRVWSLMVQIALAAGSFLPAATTAALLSGLVGMLSYQALGLSIYAICRRPWIAATIPILIHISNATAYGPAYPIWLMGHASSYGIVGLAWMALALAALGSGLRPLGLVLVGMAPCVHATLGGVLWAVLALALPVQTAWMKSWSRRDLVALLGGLGATGVSFLVYAWTTGRLPDPVMPEENFLPYLHRFLEAWSYSHVNFPFQSPGFLMAVAAMVLVALALARLRMELLPEENLFFKLLLVVGALGVLLAVGSHMPVSTMPVWFWQIMPTRPLNLVVLLFPCLIVGLALRLQDRGSVMATVALAVALVAWFVEAFKLGKGEPWMGTAAAAGLLVLSLVLPSNHGAHADRRGRRWLGLLRGVQGACIAAAAYLAVSRTAALHMGWPPVWRWPQPGALVTYDDYDASHFYQVLRGEEGLLVASGLSLLQFAARRPLLMPEAINQGLYVPASFPVMTELLHDVYGVEFWRDTFLDWSPGLERYKELWMQRTPEQWRILRARYGVTTVVTYHGWKLQLPLLAEDGQLAAWSIPAGP